MVKSPDLINGIFAPHQASTVDRHHATLRLHEVAIPYPEIEYAAWSHPLLGIPRKLGSMVSKWVVTYL